MKKLMLVMAAAIVALSLVACNTAKSWKVEGNDIAANGTPVALVSANSAGITLLFHIIPIIGGGDLDTVINKTLVTEAKAAGGNRVQIVDAMQAPRKGIFMLTGGIIGVGLAFATGIAVK